MGNMSVNKFDYHKSGFNRFYSGDGSDVLTGEFLYGDGSDILSTEGISLDDGSGFSNREIRNANTVVTPSAPALTKETKSGLLAINLIYPELSTSIKDTEKNRKAGDEILKKIVALIDDAPNQVEKLLRKNGVTLPETPSKEELVSAFSTNSTNAQLVYDLYQRAYGSGDSFQNAADPVSAIAGAAGDIIGGITNVFGKKRDLQMTQEQTRGKMLDMLSAKESNKTNLAIAALQYKSNKDASKATGKDNTLLYAGIGGGALLLVTGIIVVISMSSKSAVAAPAA